MAEQPNLMSLTWVGNRNMGQNIYYNNVENSTINKKRALKKTCQCLWQTYHWGKKTIKVKHAVLDFSLSVFTIVSNIVQKQFKIADGALTSDKIIYIPWYDEWKHLVPEIYKVHDAKQYIYVHHISLQNQLAQDGQWSKSNRAICKERNPTFLNS